MESDPNQTREKVHKGHVLYRRLGHFHPIAARGRGVYLWDSDGRRYLDGSSGAAVVNIGHGVRKVAEAMVVGFGTALNLGFARGELTPEEVAWVAELRAEKYASDVWTWRL